MLKDARRDLLYAKQTFFCLYCGVLVQIFLERDDKSPKQTHSLLTQRQETFKILTSSLIKLLLVAPCYMFFISSVVVYAYRFPIWVFLCFHVSNILNI